LHRERRFAAASLCGAELLRTMAFVESDDAIEIRAAPFDYLVLPCLLSVPPNLTPKIELIRSQPATNKQQVYEYLIR
jgi:hypothetical protein